MWLHSSALFSVIDDDISRRGKMVGKALFGWLHLKADKGICLQERRVMPGGQEKGHGDLDFRTLFPDQPVEVPHLRFFFSPLRKGFEQTKNAVRFTWNGVTQPVLFEVGVRMEEGRPVIRNWTKKVMSVGRLDCMLKAVLTRLLLTSDLWLICSFSILYFLFFLKERVRERERERERMFF